jgi:hypothetical protein
MVVNPISGLPLYISIRPVILTCLPSIPDSTGDLLTGDAGGIQPVKAVHLRIVLDQSSGCLAAHAI